MPDTATLGGIANYAPSRASSYTYVDPPYENQIHNTYDQFEEYSNEEDGFSDTEYEDTDTEYKNTDTEYEDIDTEYEDADAFEEIDALSGKYGFAYIA